MRPSRGRVGVWFGEKACCISQVLKVRANHARARMRPISPIRL